MTSETAGSPKARRLAIAEAVIRKGSMSVEDIARMSGVSTMTIYRDLVALEDSGVVQRHRGEVVALATGLHEADAEFRLEQHCREKQAVGQAGAALVPQGSSIMLDDSTTAIWLLRALPDPTSMTVVTNSLVVANEVVAAHSHSAKLIITGGEYQPWAHAMTGASVTGQLASMHADFCFLSASGVTHNGCYHPYQEVADVKRAMLLAAERKVLLLDHTKFSRRALFRFAELSDFDQVIVDDGAQGAVIDALRAREVPVRVAVRRPQPSAPRDQGRRP